MIQREQRGKAKRVKREEKRDNVFRAGPGARGFLSSTTFQHVHEPRPTSTSQWNAPLGPSGPFSDVESTVDSGHGTPSLPKVPLTLLRLSASARVLERGCQKAPRVTLSRRNLSAPPFQLPDSQRPWSDQTDMAQHSPSHVVLVHNAIPNQTCLLHRQSSST